MLMVVEVLRYWAYGRIARYYIEPTFFFSFVEWIRPVGSAMYLVFVLMGASALLLAIGYYYRAASVLFFVLYTYTFLLDKAQYNNHYYLICLLAFLFAMTDANRTFSIDSVRQRLPSHVPAWQIYIFRLQICIVFFYAGVAKINSDWLAGEPVRMWLAARSDYFLIGPLLLREWFVYAYAYAGLLFDLFIGFVLLWSPTRGIGLGLLVGFNALNKWFYNIGIFPYLTMATFAIFMNASTIRRFLDRWPRTRAVGRALVLDLMGSCLDARGSASCETTTYAGSIGRRSAYIRSHATAFLRGCLKILGTVPCGRGEGVSPSKNAPSEGPQRGPPGGFRPLLIAVFVLVQLVAPLRHLAIRGHVGWTEEGHNFSWRMKLRDKRVHEIAFYTRDPLTGSTLDLSTAELTSRQKTKMSRRPHMILQYAKHLAENLQRKGVETPVVYVRTSVSLNSRDPQPLIDEQVNLAAVQYRCFAHNDWITFLD